LVTATLLLAGQISASAIKTEARDGKNTNQRVIEAAGQHWNQHPGDYAGLTAAITKTGGDTIRFSFPEAGLTDLTGAEAQRLVDEARTTGQARAEAQGKITAIPVNAFEVSSSWYHVQAQDGEWWNFNGSWNFQNTYLVGQAPDDGTGMAIAAMPSCFRLDTDTFFSARLSGLNTSGAGYRKSVDTDSAVYGVRDRNESHVMNVDHGTLTMSYQRRTDGCSLAQTRGRFYYEHNTGGNATWSGTVDLSILHLTYSGTLGGRLQKAAALDYLS
jgi:hypothetical protein